MAHKLLLADDSVTIQRVIELTFADEDIEVVAVGDGKQAIARIEAEPPDVVLADVGMPERDGYEVAAFVKGTPRLAHIPVLLLTGAFEPVDEARARAAGCDGVLVKPFEPQMVINRVKDLLAGRRSEALWATPPTSPARPPAARARPGAHAGAVPGQAGRRAAGRGRRASVGFPRRLLRSPRRGVRRAGRPRAGRGRAAPKRRDTPGGARRGADRAAASVGVRHARARAPRPQRPGRPTTGWAAGTPVWAARSLRLRRPLAPAGMPAPPAPAATRPARRRAGRGVAHGPGAPIQPAEPPRPAPPAAPPAPDDAPAALPSLSDAFGALLAAEQGQPREDATAPLTDETIDLVVQKVVERLTTAAVRETVVDVAERLVREEIARIKNAAH